MRNVRNRGFKHCENTEQPSVLVCVFFEKSEISLRSGSSMSIVSLPTGQIAKLLAGRAEMRMPYASRTSKYGKNVD